MSIAVITLTDGANYGNRLQNYAVEQVLISLGRQVNTWTQYHYYAPDLLHKCWYVVKCILKKSNYLYTRRSMRFSHFDHRILHCVCASAQDTRNYDYLVYGSDQIWNPQYVLADDDSAAFFLGENVPKKKKIAYSASIGTTDMPIDISNRFCSGVRDFRSISVREEQAANMICELTGRKVPITIDPTLMLGAADWGRIEKKPRYVRKNERILLTYFLGDLSPARKAFVDAVAQQFGLRMVALQNEWAKDIPDPAVYATTPDEFIWLVHHCQLMLTDSFHGSVFSILFDKPFRCFGREESGVADMSSRMDTLFGKFGIGDWCRGSVQEDPDHIFYKDYASVPAVLERERQFALDYLKNALEIHE
ncbi:MAG: polysaccharide pyruvyl transferase family protein [Clostridium sp.]|nr:polysaccharide pyruvyl transferase family protein [Clostridium sp.]